ncbi:hypothetical protein [Methylobacterium sp. JK268]
MACRCKSLDSDGASSIGPLAYRAYLIEADRIVGVERIDAEDDVEALLKARGLDLPFDVEIWERGRRVIGFQRHRARHARA